MARSFNDSNYIDVGNPTEVQVTGDVTVGAWIRFSVDQNNHPLIARWGGDQAYLLMVDFSSANKIKFLIRVSEVNKVAVSVNNYNDGDWHYVSGGFNGSNVLLRIFSGAGVLEESITGDATSGPIDNPGSGVDLRLGGYSDVTTLNFLGDMANSAIFDANFSTDLLRTIALKGPHHAPPGSLKGWWPITGASIEPDWSGNGNNGTVTGTALADNPPVAPPFGFDLGWQGNFVPAAPSGAIPHSVFQGPFAGPFVGAF